MADDCDQIYSSLEEKKRKRIFPNPHLKVNLHVPLATHGSSTPSTAAAEIASYRRSSSLSRKRVVDAVHSYEMFGSDIYGGVGGVAYMHWRYALADGEGREDHLKKVEEMVSGMEQRWRQKSKARVKRRERPRISFFCGEPGFLTLQVLLACAQRDNQTAEKALDAAVNVYTEWIALEPSEYCNEVLYGRAGYLHSLLVSIQGVRRAWDWKVDNVGGEESVLYVKMKNAEDVAGQVARELIQIGSAYAKRHESDFPEAQRPPLMYEWHSSRYLGAAHGLTGILFTLLLAEQYWQSDKEMNELVIGSLDYLMSLRLDGGNYPSRVGKSEDRLVQWCHGAPGFALVFALAYEHRKVK